MKQKKKFLGLGNRGVISYVILYFFMFCLLVFIAALIIPSMQLVNTQSYLLNQQIIGDQNDLIQKIIDVNVRVAFQNSLNSQQESIQTNQDILSLMARYSWAIIAFILLLVMFIYTRERVQIGSGV